MMPPESRKESTMESTIYEIIDSRTGNVVATRLTSKRAHAKADQLDRNYGAVRYIVRPVFSREAAV